MGIKSYLEENFDVDIVDEFIDHYSIMVECLENMIIDLEKDEMYQRSIEELGRVFHNINASTSYLNLNSVAKLASFVEKNLKDIKENYIRVNEETIAWLLSLNDLFILWRNELLEDRELSHIEYKHIKLPHLE
ncbi:MAG: chemotaxis protein CheA [Sulfurimonas sp.]|jgi:two-component system chemotaxis sensor kinase CheA|nr:chemotaxis protein CheA [Sulfurimonadaceae bacterium]